MAIKSETTREDLKVRGNALALLPLGIFLMVYLVSAVVTKDFYKMPVSVAFLTATASALIMNRKKTIDEKLEVFCKGAGQ
ncbi:MAG: hypothetical protein RSB70_02450 [Clostridium sp.]